jgi:hypothetical protein
MNRESSFALIYGSYNVWSLKNQLGELSSENIILTLVRFNDTAVYARKSKVWYELTLRVYVLLILYVLLIIRWFGHMASSGFFEKNTYLTIELIVFNNLLWTVRQCAIKQNEHWLNVRIEDNCNLENVFLQLKYKFETCLTKHQQLIQCSKNLMICLGLFSPSLSFPWEVR